MLTHCLHLCLKGKLHHHAISTVSKRDGKSRLTWCGCGHTARCRPVKSAIWSDVSEISHIKAGVKREWQELSVLRHSSKDEQGNYSWSCPYIPLTCGVIKCLWRSLWLTGSISMSRYLGIADDWCNTHLISWILNWITLILSERASEWFSKVETCQVRSSCLVATT